MVRGDGEGMKIYISGRITETSDYLERFAKTETLLTKIGDTVINPAKINAQLPENTDYDDYMRLSFVLLDMADAIYMMNGWEKSKGARMELLKAYQTGKRIIFEGEDRYVGLEMDCFTKEIIAETCRIRCSIRG